jgi:hypothetical protein
MLDNPGRARRLLVLALIAALVLMVGAVIVAVVAR